MSVKATELPRGSEMPQWRSSFDHLVGDGDIKN
jgi:hypothetical protein